MVGPEENGTWETGGKPEEAARRGFTGETDRETGEYHYRNGYTQKIYSDAHYVPAGESTAPPKYYTPPEKPVREPRAPRPRHEKKGGFLRTLLICLLCALLGASGAALWADARMDRELDQMRGSLDEMRRELDTARQELDAAQKLSAAPAAESAGEITASNIYNLGCRQVVGITTEVTYTNWFGMTSSNAVSGSGFIISPDGYILTNHHVVEDALSGNLAVTVMLHDGSQYQAEIVGAENDGSDVAVLKIDAEGLDAAVLANSDGISVGEDVFVVGNPLGELAFSMTIGHVSALDRGIVTDSDSGAINMFQLDAAVNPGNSGGPVYNSQGQVIGVVTAKYSDTDVEGLGFAIPINDAFSIASDLMTKGYVTGKAYLGVQIDRRYNSMYSQYYGMPIGAYVDSVEKGGCAEAAGLRAGDIITQLGDQSISGYDDLRAALREFSAGDSAPLVYYRAGESQTVSVTFDEVRPSSSQTASAYQGAASRSFGRG